jgi:hypothetical protein
MNDDDSYDGDDSLHSTTMFFATDTVPESVVHEMVLHSVPKMVPYSVPNDIMIPEMVPPSVAGDIMIPETVPQSVPNDDAFGVPILDMLTSPPSIQSNWKRSAPPSSPQMVRIIVNDSSVVTIITSGNNTTAALGATVTMTNNNPIAQTRSTTTSSPARTSCAGTIPSA